MIRQYVLLHHKRKCVVNYGNFVWNIRNRIMGVGWIFSRGGLRVFSLIFLGGPKVSKFVFSHSKLRKQPFLTKISKSRGPWPPCPTSDAHDLNHNKNVLNLTAFCNQGFAVPRLGKTITIHGKTIACAVADIQVVPGVQWTPGNEEKKLKNGFRAFVSD